MLRRTPASSIPPLRLEPAPRPYSEASPDTTTGEPNRLGSPASTAPATRAANHIGARRPGGWGRRRPARTGEADEPDAAESEEAESEEAEVPERKRGRGKERRPVRAAGSGASSTSAGDAGSRSAPGRSRTWGALLRDTTHLPGRALPCRAPVGGPPGERRS